MWKIVRVIYDIETYPNCFTVAAEHADYPIKWMFEISTYRNDSVSLFQWLQWLRDNDFELVGFNNIGFDYVVLHYFILRQGNASATELYNKAMEVIRSGDEDRFANFIKPSDRFVKQIDLFKIRHFDNKAKQTSLKALEFNMRLDNIEDLPFLVGTVLNREQIETLKQYNQHDVTATKRFYHETLEQIAFREQLTVKHGRDFMNHNDTKIGAEIFQMELEKAGVQCYEYDENGRKPQQTPRDQIVLSNCVPQWIEFKNPEFKRIRDWLNQQVITETKGVFKDLVATVNGMDFVYGTGGLHASVENQYIEADDEYIILDADVTSLYPSIAIEHGHYPEHLGQTFVGVYRSLREQRVSYAKGSAENAMLKLALNGTYGKSNDKFSIFYDPQFTMTITISGQLMISLLAERFMGIHGLSIIQVNTDGITVKLPRSAKFIYDMVCKQWEQETKLQLEFAEYSKMIIRDVNSYLAQKLDGSVKRKGAYEYKVDWHQNAGGLVIPKVAEQVLIYGKPIFETLLNWEDRMDFMLRVKIPRSSHLIGIDESGDEHQLQNTCRYYVSKGGYQLIKKMPPTLKQKSEGKTDWRKIGVESGWTVFPCNDIKQATLPINYNYYIREVEKLVLVMR